MGRKVAYLPRGTYCIRGPSSLIFSAGLPMVPRCRRVFKSRRGTTHLPGRMHSDDVGVRLFSNTLGRAGEVLRTSCEATVPRCCGRSVRLLLPVYLHRPKGPSLTLTYVGASSKDGCLKHAYLALEVTCRGTELLTEISQD